MLNILIRFILIFLQKKKENLMEPRHFGHMQD